MWNFTFHLSISALPRAVMVLLLLAFGLPLHGQVFDREQIQSSQIRRMLQELEIEQMDDFQAVGSYCYQSQADHPVPFFTHQKRFIFDIPLQTLWSQYLSSSPDQAWRGRLVDFGLCYTPHGEEVYLPFQHYPGLAVGQLHFLELNFLGLAEIAVGHQVTEIDREEHFIKLCYLQGGKSQGSQWILLREVEPGRTEVSHFTRYKSDSKFRDSKMYPLLHSWVISCFHRNIARLARDSDS